jgi:hypothetical protein
MTRYRKQLIDFIRPELKRPVTRAFVARFDAILDECGVPRDSDTKPTPVLPAPRFDVPALRMRLSLHPEGGFDSAARTALFARLSNKSAPRLELADFERAASDLGVSPGLMEAVREVEAPRGAFDPQGRPSILYEKHVFSRASGRRFDAAHPLLSAPTWQPGTYGPSTAQYGKLADACALDPDAAFKACSWGAFQILGENAQALGYASAFDMALALTKSEAAHLDCFIRFLRSKHLVEALRAAKPGDPESCIPFVRGYNGPAYAANDYHVKLARAALRSEAGIPIRRPAP